MNWMERMRTMLQTWLEIQPAEGRRLSIREPVSHGTNVLRNRVWYRGDAGELDQLFKQLGEDAVGRARFWAAAPESENLRKAHSGLPAVMVDTLAGIVRADLDEMHFDDPQAARRWEDIARDNDFETLVGRAVAECLVTGDGAFKISLDPQAAPGPILEFYGADRVEYARRHGRITGVDFLTPVGRKGRVLYEEYRPGSVGYRLEADGKLLPLSAEEDCAGLRNTAFDPTVSLAVPLMFWPSARWPGRGASLFDKKNDAFDAHDEIISQWLDAVRAGRVQRYIPECLIPRDPETGALRVPGRFGASFVKIASSDRENAADRIETVQPEIRYEAFESAYAATLDLCLQGVLSPATLGIDLGRMASAEAQREKKDVTGFTRNAITAALEKALPLLARAALQAQDLAEGRAPGEYVARAGFGEYGAPAFDERVNTVARAAEAGIMSVEAQVDELWGASRDEAWKTAEAARIRAERGAAG